MVDNSIVNAAEVNAAQMTAPAVNSTFVKNVNDSDDRKKRRDIPAVSKVVRDGKKKFDAQLEKNKTTETKRDCLNECVSKFYQDRLRFWQDFRTQAERLTDSKKFEKRCKEKGLDIQAVAEHVVFEGSVVLNRVIRYGVEAVLGERMMMFHTPIYKDENNLYSKLAGSKEQGADKTVA